MISWSDNDLYAGNLALASDDLAKALFRGELALCLGAGVSKQLGLPTWDKLVSDCLDACGLTDPTILGCTDVSKLKNTVGDVRRKLKDDKLYHELVTRLLYQGIKGRTPANATSLLTSLGALMMGSRRGRIREVWTLNFDDTIEWYLRMNGFLSQVVTEFPCLLRDVDVTVYHPHGFLPMDKRHGIASGRIVFDDTSYAEYVFGKDEAMLRATENIVESKVLLAIGVSWSDDTLQNLLKANASKIKNRPLAFWFFGPAAPGKLKDLENNKKNCSAHNVVPLQFADYDEYPGFLLNICEKAMEGVSRGW